MLHLLFRLLSPALASSHAPAILNHVRHDQGSRKEDQAEDEVAEKAVPFAGGNASRPERDSYPDDQEQERPEPPTT